MTKTILELRDEIIGNRQRYRRWDGNEFFLALAICGETGELANLIKKRWRDGTDHTAEIRDEIADIRVYLEQLAQLFDIEGDKLNLQVADKLRRVVEKDDSERGEDNV